MENLGISQKLFIPKQERSLSEVEGSYTYFAEGDVLLAKITPCFENGKLGIAKNLKNGIGFGSSEYIVFRTNNSLYNEFLYYFLSQEEFRINGAKRMAGAVGHKRVAKDFIEDTRIPLPPLSEQKRIVAILDESFSAIEKAKENAEKNLANARELFESYLQGVFATKSKDWEEKCLEELGVITSSKRIYKSEYVKEGIPFYRTKEIKELSNGKEITLELFISKKRYYEIKKTFGVPQINDLLMSAVGTIGEIMVIENDDEFYFKDGNIVWFKEFLNLDTNYLKFALTAFVEKIKSLAIGSAYNALTIEKLNKYKIFFPKSIKEQQIIVNKIDVLSAETKRLESIYRKKLNDLDELKKSILNKAFKGEL
jgi:type I restriction enzyme S subunit